MIAKTAAALGVLALNLYVYHFFATDPVHPDRRSLTGFPTQLGDWSCPERQLIPDETLANLGVTDYIVCDYREKGTAAPVSVYVGYHATQVREAGGGAGENAIHPPAHCLPGSGWEIIEREKVALSVKGLPERPARVNRLVIAKGEARQLAYYWYQSRGRVIADDWKKILLVTWDRAIQSRTDGSLVRLTTPIGSDGVEAADERILALARSMLPRLSRYVPE